MKMKDVIKVCGKAIPREVEYTAGEPYGPYNIDDLDVEVKKALYCVTPSRAIEKFFREGGYDLLISHHPYIVRVPQLIYHTALDCCEGGLNDMWADALRIEDRKHFDKDLGWVGKLPEPLTLTELVREVEAFCGPVEGQVYTKNHGQLIESVSICSGLGGLVDNKAKKYNADCYILGEAIRPAHEMGFNAVIETGHTRSEWIGWRFFTKLLGPHGVYVDYPEEMRYLDVFGVEYYHDKR